MKNLNLITNTIQYRDVPTVVGSAHHSDKIVTTTDSLISTKISTPMKMLSLNFQLLYVIHIYRIAQLCGGGKYWRIYSHSPMFYLPIFSLANFERKIL